MNIESIKQCIENIEKELIELKVFVNEIKPEKTPNQLRAELIEKAKSFVEIKSSYLKDSSECNGCYTAKKRENPNYCKFVMKCEFIVNAEKRTVVAILKYLNNSIQRKSIAKCDPSDVFNEHIGKAIALGRALGLDVSEFVKAVQPTWIVKGMIVTNKDGGVREVKEGHNHDGYPVLFANDTSSTLKIINDTNAIYGGVE